MWFAQRMPVCTPAGGAYVVTLTDWRAAEWRRLAGVLNYLIVEHVLNLLPNP